MDNSPRTAALQTAKAIISTHGLSAFMNVHNRSMLQRDIDPTSSGLRCEFQLDPTKNSWSGTPTCGINLSYVPSPGGSRLADDGASVLDHTLRLTVSATGSEMTLSDLDKREDMLSLLRMLCVMLTTSLPQTVTCTLATATELVDAQQRTMEQAVGDSIVRNIGIDVLKGLRRDGASRGFRLTATYTSADGKYPQPGTYRYKYTRRTDSRGRPKEVLYYSIRVYAELADGTPPLVAVRRVGNI